MALLERGLKQRIVGALVLIALAVIFLPMLFTREDESRQVVVEAPPRPQSPAMPSVEVQPTEVPELQPGEEGIAPEIVEEGSPAAAGQPSRPPRPRPRRRPPACRQASRNRPLRRRARRPRRSAWTPTTCRRAGRYSLPACPTGRAPRNCRRPCAPRATTPTSAASTG